MLMQKKTFPFTFPYSSLLLLIQLLLLAPLYLFSLTKLSSSSFPLAAIISNDIGFNCNSRFIFLLFTFAIKKFILHSDTKIIIFLLMKDERGELSSLTSLFNTHGCRIVDGWQSDKVVTI